MDYSKTSKAEYSNESRFENILQQSLAPLMEKLSDVESSVEHYTDSKKIADLRKLIENYAVNTNKKLEKFELEIKNCSKLLERTAQELRAARSDFECHLAIKNEEIIKINNKINNIGNVHKKFAKTDREIKTCVNLFENTAHDLQNTKNDFERKLAIKNVDNVKLSNEISEIRSDIYDKVYSLIVNDANTKIGIENLNFKLAIVEQKLIKNENNWVSSLGTIAVILIVCFAVAIMSMPSLKQIDNKIVDIENIISSMHSQRFTENGVKKALFYPLNGEKPVCRSVAITLCAKYNATLIDIESGEKQKIVDTFLIKINQTEFRAQSWYWISGYKLYWNGKYRWLTTGNEFKYTNWAHTATHTDLNKLYACIYSGSDSSEIESRDEWFSSSSMQSSHGKWFTTSSDRSLSVLCEKIIN